MLIFFLALGCFIVTAWFWMQHQHPAEHRTVIDYQVEEEFEIASEEPKLQRCGDFACFSAKDFLALFSSFEREHGLSYYDVPIYELPEVDTYLRDFAEARGYHRRGFADEEGIVWFENIRTLPEIRDAYIAMRNAMQKQGIRLHFVSAYRSASDQRRIFTDKANLTNPRTILDGSQDTNLDAIFAVSALPGYSKHHTGYAVDFGCGNDYLVYSFADTNCYAWLSANNFENAKRYGFIPSYPEGAENQGPDPEPWEFVWVGSDLLK